jgi:hypothetical protein
VPSDFPEEITKAWYRIFFSHAHGVATNGEKNQAPRNEKHRALHLSACRLVESIVFTLVNCVPNVGSIFYQEGSQAPA